MCATDEREMEKEVINQMWHKDIGESRQKVHKC